MSGSPKDDERSDQELWQRVCQGDREAFRHVHRRHGPLLLGYLTRQCRPPLDPVDLAQDFWLRAWEKRSQCDGTQLRAWLFQLARTSLADTLRRLCRQPVMTSTEGFDAEQVPPDLERLQREDRERVALSECLREVGSDFVKVIQMQLEGNDTQTIAERLDIETATVYTRRSRGIQLLKDCVEKKMK